MTDVDLLSKFEAQDVEDVFDFDATFAKLSEQQKTAVDLARKKKSFLLTGPAGTGKSQVLNVIQHMQNDRRVVFKLTAMTGTASQQIKGRTIHSILRMFPNDLEKQKKVSDWKAFVDSQIEWNPVSVRGRTQRNQTKSGYWSNWQCMEMKKTEVLIIDEVSMLSPDFFDKMDQLLRKVRDTDKPFGGICLILVGDFCQLSPVEPGEALSFVFLNKLFWQVMTDIVVLKKCYRQEDQSTVDLMNRVRLAQTTSEDNALFETCVHRSFQDNGIVPTKIFACNWELRDLNERELAKIDDPTVKFSCKQFISRNEKCVSDQARLDGSGGLSSNTQWTKELQETIRNTNIDETLALKVGAQVMLCQNINVPGGLYNGARGVITGFRKHSCPDPDAKFKILHQLESRIRALEDMDVEEDFSKQNLFVQPNIELPVVRFEDGTQHLVPYARFSRSFTEQNCSDHMAAHTWQVPLRLAWGITVHKSQGMTLNCAEMGTDNMFAHGQVQTGLSRVRSLDGLSLRSWDPSKIQCDERVVQFQTQTFAFLKNLQLD